MSFPCKMCGARPDVECRHRPAEPPKPRPVLPDDSREGPRGRNATALGLFSAPTTAGRNMKSKKHKGEK